MRQEHVITIARPPEEVFDFVDDMGNMTKWAEGLVSVRVLEETPGRVGTRYVMVIREGRAENEYEGELLAWERGRHRRSSATRKGWTMVGDMRFDPAPGGGTRLTHAVEYEMRGATKLMTPFVWLMNRIFLKKQAEAVKRLVEAR